MFRNLDLFPSSDEGRETPILFCPYKETRVQLLRLALSKRPNRVGVSRLLT
jgi:hypothetical protein